MANRRVLTREGASKLFNQLLEKRSNLVSRPSTSPASHDEQILTTQPTNPLAGLTDEQIEEVTSIISITPGQTLVVFFRDEKGQVVRELVEKLTRKEEK